MNDTHFYVVHWIFCSGCCYLLWRDGGEGKDEYAKLPNSEKLLIAHSVEDILDMAKQCDMPTSGNVSQVLDFCVVSLILNSLRPARLISRRTACVLLEAWNALDDLAYSIGASFVSIDDSFGDEMNLIYSKLFYGSNLSSVTPEGKRFHPGLNMTERNLLKKQLRNSISCAELHLLGGRSPK